MRRTRGHTASARSSVACGARRNANRHSWRCSPDCRGAQNGGDDTQCVALQRNLCAENDLSATTAEDAAQRVRALLELHAPVKNANPSTGGDSIF